MKTIYYGILFFIISSTSAQEIKESIQPISNKARKGYMYEASKDNDGNTAVIFQMKIDKKSDAVAFEKYSFDKNLKFLNSSDTQEKKAVVPDYEK